MAKQVLVSEIMVEINQRDHEALQAGFRLMGGKRDISLVMTKFGGGKTTHLTAQLEVEEAQDLRDALDSMIRHVEAERKRHGDP